jgi:hypothetical protein
MSLLEANGGIRSSSTTWRRAGRVAPRRDLPRFSLPIVIWKSRSHPTAPEPPRRSRSSHRPLCTVAQRTVAHRFCAAERTLAREHFCAIPLIRPTARRGGGHPAGEPGTISPRSLVERLFWFGMATRHPGLYARLSTAPCGYRSFSRDFRGASARSGTGL